MHDRRVPFLLILIRIPILISLFIFACSLIRNPTVTVLSPSPVPHLNPCVVNDSRPRRHAGAIACLRPMPRAGIPFDHRPVEDGIVLGKKTASSATYHEPECP